MLGYITTQDVIDARNLELRGMEPFPAIEITGRPLVAGGVFVSMDESCLESVAINTLRVMDLPPIAEFIDSFGGLDSRVTVQPADFVSFPIPS